MCARTNTCNAYALCRFLLCLVLLLWGVAESRGQGFDEKIDALDAAHKAGVLTQEEYARKKAELEQEASAGAAKEKLQALDAALQAGVLTEAEYQRKKAELTGTPAVAPAPAPLVVPTVTETITQPPQPEAVNPAPAKTAGNTYRHPTGVSIWYPSGWKPQMLEGILQLIPPSASTSAEDFEAYFVTAEEVGSYGITEPNHPMVAQYLDEQMQSLGGELGVHFQRKGNAVPVDISKGKGQGIRVDWTADSQIGEVKARTYVCILKNYGFVLAGVGVKDRLAKREKDILRIFASLDVGEGKKDPNLVGTWRLTRTTAITNQSVWETDYSRAQLVSETNSVLRFSPDGTWEREDKSEMLVGGAGIWLENNERSVNRGRWNADGGALFMVWEDQSFEDYQYRVAGNELKIVCDKTGQLWTRVN